MLLTTFARRRQLAIWCERARDAAARLERFARQLAATGHAGRAFRFARAAWRARAYLLRCETALLELRHHHAAPAPFFGV